MSMKKFNHYLAERQIQKLNALSRHTGLSVSELLRRAIDEGLKEENLYEVLTPEKPERGER